MRNRITRYEVVASDGRRRWLVGYTPRRSRHGLLVAMRAIGNDLIRVMGLTDVEIVTWPDTRTADFGNGWRVYFSGRTQIDAQDHGELMFLPDRLRGDS